MGRIKIDYGIDLGTTNSALSRMESGEVVTSEIDQSRIVPSCVYIDKKGRNRVGIQAFNKYPHFIEFKRNMGVNIDYDTLDGNKTNPEKLSAELLKKLASEITDEVFKSVVITVPAAFELPQVSATKRAAELVNANGLAAEITTARANEGANTTAIRLKTGNLLFLILEEEPLMYAW